ncbi:MAG: CARDB domain-containing protein [Halanaeroarchaeum sp.]
MGRLSRRPLSALIVAALLLQSMAVGPALAADATIDRTTTLSLSPERPGSVRAVVTFDVPTNVVSLTTTVPDSATVLETVGFEPDGPDGYTWDGTGADPRLTLRLAVNRTGAGLRAAAAQSGYEFVDVGPWAIVASPAMSTTWSYRGEKPTFQSSIAVDGEGVAGERMVYLGPSRTYTRSAAGQTVRLVVPSTADLAPSPDAVLDSLASASLHLRVGERDPRVTVIAAPTTVDWAAAGLAADADAWVLADRSLGVPDNIWLHEYVHTRAAFQTSPSARWATEATAEYYAALLSLEQDLIDFEAFRDHLALGTRRPYPAAVLSEPETWARGANYLKGALVYGSLDRRLRMATDGRVTGETLLARMNARREPIDHAALRAMVADLGTESTVDFVDRYVTTDAVPEPWTAGEHAAVFGQPVARMTVDPNLSFAIRGPYRDANASQPPILVPDETLVVEATVENVGEEAGSYSVSLAHNGTTVDTARGDLTPGESTTVSLRTTLESIGEHRLSVGPHGITVRVEEPATPAVQSLAVDPSTVRPGSRTTIRATVGNPAAKPAKGTLTPTVDGRPLAERVVRLAPGETRVVEWTVSPESTGRYVVRLAAVSATLSVSVEDRSTSTVRTRGLGVGVAAVALLIGALLVDRRS